MLIVAKMWSLETDDAARPRSFIKSGVGSAECVKLVVLVVRDSRLSLFFRLKMAFPIAWTLSGRSFDGMLLVVDLMDDFLDKEKDSRACSQDGRRSDVA